MAPLVVTGNTETDQTTLIPFVATKAAKEPESVTVAVKVNLFEGEIDGEEKSPSLSVSGTPQKNANRKKLRGIDGQAVDSNPNITVNSGSATPLEGDRQDQ